MLKQSIVLKSRGIFPTGIDQDQIRQIRAFEGRFSNALDVCRIHNCDPRLCVAQPECEGFGAKQDRKRHADRAQSHGRQVRHSGLNALRQNDRDPVAGFDTQCVQRVGQLA